MDFITRWKKNYVDSFHGDLTPQQKKALKFVADYIDEFGIHPTMVQLAEVLGVKSKSTAFKHISSLVKRNKLIKKGWDTPGPRFAVTPEGMKVLKGNMDDNQLIEAIKNLKACVGFNQHEKKDEIIQELKDFELLIICGTEAEAYCSEHF